MIKPEQPAIIGEWSKFIASVVAISFASLSAGLWISAVGTLVFFFGMFLYVQITGTLAFIQFVGAQYRLELAQYKLYKKQNKIS